jgi:hypothetical protein
MDSRVLAAADAAASRRAHVLRRRVMLASGAVAASLLVAAVFVAGPLLRGRDPDERPVRTEGGVAVAPSAIAEDVLSARAALLELRVTRLMQEAALSDSTDRYLDELDRLASELDTLERVYLSTAPVTNAVESKPERESEDSEDENGSQSYRPSTGNPVGSGVRAGGCVRAG